MNPKKKKKKGVGGIWVVSKMGKFLKKKPKVVVVIEGGFFFSIINTKVESDL